MQLLLSSSRGLAFWTFLCRHWLVLRVFIVVRWIFFSFFVLLLFTFVFFFFVLLIFKYCFAGCVRITKYSAAKEFVVVQKKITAIRRENNKSNFTRQMETANVISSHLATMLSIVSPVHIGRRPFYTSFYVCCISQRSTAWDAFGKSASVLASVLVSKLGHVGKAEWGIPMYKSHQICQGMFPTCSVW